MSRSGYSDDIEDHWSRICYRGAVAAALRGRRGQAFLRELLEALDALPEKKLIAHDLITEGGCCALGAVALKRGIDQEMVRKLDPEAAERIAEIFGIATAMAREIMFENDEAASYWESITDEERFRRMRHWVVVNLKQEVADAEKRAGDRAGDPGGG